MAIAQQSEGLSAQLAITHHNHDPNSTSATDVAWVDMRDFSYFLASFTRTAGTSAVTGFRILANSASDGSGTDVEVKTKTISSQPDADGDHIFLECAAEEIRQAGVEAGEDVRYVSLQFAFGTATDEGVVTYVRKGKHCHSGLTADVIS